MKLRYPQDRLNIIAWLGGCCLGCGTDRNLELDHMYPRRHGKCTNQITNLQVLCCVCNRIKRDRYINFKKYVPIWFKMHRVRGCNDCREKRWPTSIWKRMCGYCKRRYNGINKFRKRICSPADYPLAKTVQIQLKELRNKTETLSHA